MSKVGTVDIKGVMLGSTEISKAYLGSDIVFQKSGLPYDAEVEWLGFLAGSKIDTLIYPSTNYKYYWKYMWHSIRPYGYVFSNGAASGDWFYFGGCETGGKSQIHIKSSAYASGTVLTPNIVYEGSFEKSGSNMVVKQNGSTYAQLAYTDFTASATLGITNAGATPILIAKFTIKDSNNNIILDLKPVRVGSTGYMYDTISGNLFGNVGSHGFIVGHDKNATLPYDSRVAFLRNTSNANGGTYFITDYTPNTTTRIALAGNVSDLTKQTRWFYTAKNPLRVDLYINGSGLYAYNFNTADNNASTRVAATKGVTLLDMNGKGKSLFIAVGGTQKVNNTNITMPSSYTSAGEYLKIFGGNTYASGMVGDMNCCCIFENGTLVRYYYPVRKDGVGYLYDILTGQLLSNSGSATLTYGADINLD